MAEKKATGLVVSALDEVACKLWVPFSRNPSSRDIEFFS